MAMSSLLRVAALAALCASCRAELDCWEGSTSYDPVNMPGQGKTEGMNAVSCQERCRSVPDCRHFSLWDDGGCHLQDGSATAKSDTKAIAGPPSCDADPSSPGEQEPVAAEPAALVVEPEAPAPPVPTTPPAPPVPTTPPPPAPTTPPPKPAAPAVPARKLSGSDWEPTYYIYLKGPREWQFRVYVGAADGSLVSIHTEDGRLDWSWVPSPTTGAVKLVYHKRGTVVLATTDGKIQALAADGGKELWDHECPSTVFHTIIDIGGAGSSYDDFALICKSHIQYVTILGELGWQTSVTNLKAAWRSRDSKHVCVLSVGASTTQRVWVAGLTGAVARSSDVPSEVHTAIVAGDYIEAGDHIVFKAGTDLKTYPLCDGGVATLGITVSNTAQLIDVQDSNDWFGISESGETRIVRLEPDGKVGMTTVEHSTAILGASHGAVYGESGKFVAVATPKDGSYDVHVKRPSGELYKTSSAAAALDVSTHGNIQRVLAQQLPISGFFRSIVSTDKKRLLALQDTRLLWARGSIDTNHAEL